MKQLSQGLMVAAVVALAGCSGNVSSKPGGITTGAGHGGTPAVSKATFKLKADNVTVTQDGKPGA